MAFWHKARVQSRKRRWESVGPQQVGLPPHLQEEIDHALESSPSETVGVELNAEGWVSELTINGDRARDLSIQELERDISRALIAASIRSQQEDAKRKRPGRMARGLDAVQLMDSFFFSEPQSAASALAPRWNGQRTVSVTIHGRAILAVACDHAWMQDNSFDTIAAEVMSAVNQAFDDLIARSKDWA